VSGGVLGCGLARAGELGWTLRAAVRARLALAVVPRRLAHVLAVVTVLLLCTDARASTVHEPAPGASVEQGKTLYFDWAWTGNEYWTSGILFAQAASKDDPIWFGPGKPGRVRFSGSYGFGYGESHATLTFDARLFAPGQWYWRLCNNTTTGEDDKCYFDGSDPIPLTVTPAPPPPPAPPLDPCLDEIDNDGDGIVDFDDYDGGADCDQVPRPPRAPTLSAAQARRVVRAALSEQFARAYDEGSSRRVRGFWRTSPTLAHFSVVSWRFGRYAFDGRATIRSRVDASARWGLVVRRTDDGCRGGCVRVIRRSGTAAG
jgi:hypothetical protein